jgi:hypothetical protein
VSLLCVSDLTYLSPSTSDDTGVLEVSITSAFIGAQQFDCVRQLWDLFSYCTDRLQIHKLDPYW